MMEKLITCMVYAETFKKYNLSYQIHTSWNEELNSWFNALMCSLLNKEIHNTDGKH